MVKPIRDQFGNTFVTLTEFEQHYAVKPHEYRINRKPSWIYDYVAFRKGVVFDHKGIRYDSMDAMLKTYDITASEYEEHQTKRSSIEELLERRIWSQSEVIAKMALDNEKEELSAYTDFQDFCDKHNMKRISVYRRLRKGMCLHDAVNGMGEKNELSEHNNKILNIATKNGYKRPSRSETQQIEGALFDKRVTDEFGNVFASIKAFATYYNLTFDEYRIKHRDYYIVDYAIFKPGVVFDHKGQRYKTEEEMCDYWGIPYSQYCKMRKCGKTKTVYSIREILENHIETSSELLARVTDEDVSITQISEWSGLNRNRILSKLRSGMNYHDLLAHKTDKVFPIEFKAVPVTVHVDVTEEVVKKEEISYKETYSALQEEMFIHAEEAKPHESKLFSFQENMYDALINTLNIGTKNLLIDEHLRIVESAHIPQRPETYGKAWVVLEDGEEKIWSIDMFKQYFKEVNNQ